jgi:hypothetical protein
MSKATFLDPKNLKIFQEYDKNVKWFMHNLKTIRTENRGKMVAVYSEGVIAADRNYETLQKKLENQGVIDWDTVFIKYIPENDDLLIV